MSFLNILKSIKQDIKNFVFMLLVDARAGESERKGKSKGKGKGKVNAKSKPRDGIR